MLSESAPCFAGIDGNSSVESVLLPWLCGITSGNGADDGGGGFARPCCICAAAGRTPPSIMRRTTVNPEKKLRRMAGIVVVISIRARLRGDAHLSYDPICSRHEQAGHFSGSEYRSSHSLDEFAEAKFQAQRCWVSREP